VKYALIFSLLAISCVIVPRLWGWTDALSFFLGAYFGIGFLILAGAYGGSNACLLLKLPNGRRSALAMVLLAPYFLLNSLLLFVYRMASKEPAYVEVAPNLHLGRRLTSAEARSTEWKSVLDLAGEFEEEPTLRCRSDYRSLPILDATAPSEEELCSAVEWIDQRAGTGPLLVHCALGHGRSATVVIAYLLSKQQVQTIDGGISRLRSLGKDVQLNRLQRSRLTAFMNDLDLTRVNTAAETRT
jgi:predicted protein tyrosine phosphatase